MSYDLIRILLNKPNDFSRKCMINKIRNRGDLFPCELNGSVPRLGVLCNVLFQSRGRCRASMVSNVGFS